MPPRPSRHELVRRFFEAFNDQRLEAFAATLHPAVELQTARGPRHGIEAARAWATKMRTGELDQRFVVESMREAGDHLVALVRRQWRWKGTERPVIDDRVAALFGFEDGLIKSWQAFDDRDEALRRLAELDPAPEMPA